MKREGDSGKNAHADERARILTMRFVNGSDQVAVMPDLLVDGDRFADGRLLRLNISVARIIEDRILTLDIVSRGGGCSDGLFTRARVGGGGVGVRRSGIEDGFCCVVGEKAMFEIM